MLTIEQFENAYENYDFYFFDNLSQYLRDYCEDNHYYDDIPMDSDELWEYIDTLSAEDAFRLAYNSEIHLADDVFCFNGYGNLESYGCWYTYFKECVDEENFIDWYNENIDKD